VDVNVRPIGRTRLASEKEETETQLPPLSAVRVAGRWPRLAAALVDVLFLALVGAIIGMLVGERIAPAGTPGRLWGLLIAVPYLAFFTSTLGGGQTFGKTWLHLRVVNAAGQPLSLARSMVRALILTAPWFANGLRFSRPSLAVAWTLWAAAVLTLGLAPASVVTFFLSRRAHQALHDLVVGSYVVEESTLGRPVAARTRPVVAAAAATWILLVMVGAGRQMRAAFSPPGEDPLMDQLARLPDVSTVIVAAGTRAQLWGNEPRTPRNVVRVQVWYRGPEDQIEPLRHDVASAVLWHAQGLGLVDVMQVTLTRGWDLGVASWTTSTTETRALDAWRAAD
jgi:uncharacterized RDD family membrane protein YckC